MDDIGVMDSVDYVRITIVRIALYSLKATLRKKLQPTISKRKKIWNFVSNRSVPLVVKSREVPGDPGWRADQKQEKKIEQSS